VLEPVTKNDMAEQLVGGPGWIAARLRAWLSVRDAFRQFVEAHERTIRKKFTSAATEPDRWDVLAELEFAYRGLADPRFAFRYEKDARCGRRSPDHLVTVAGIGDFNLEVKRIRESRATDKLNRFLNTLLDSLAAVPSGAGVWVEITGDDDSALELVERLEQATPTVVARCVEIVRAVAPHLADDEKFTIPIDEFEEHELRITIDRLPAKPADAPTVYLGGSTRVPYTQRESFKFTDLICGCLGQLRNGMPNVLAVRVQSCTHDVWDLRGAISAMAERVRSTDDEFFRRKGFADTMAFQEQMLTLSAIVVVNDWEAVQPAERRNYVWRNAAAAVPLPAEVVTHFEMM
jgi:hypothetical protein